MEQAEIRHEIFKFIDSNKLQFGVNFSKLIEALTFYTRPFNAKIKILNLENKVLQINTYGDKLVIRIVNQIDEDV